MKQTINQVIDLLVDMQDKKFWGSVEIVFKDGKVIVVKREETIIFK